MKYPVYFPRSGKTFNTPSACSNHISRGSIYKDQKDAYHDVFKLESEPECLFCDENAEFISFSKGYKQYCSSEECKRKYRCKRNKEIGKKKSEHYDANYISHIKKNIDFYRDVIKTNEPYYDSYFEKWINNPICFIRTKAKNEYFNEERICVITGEYYTINVLRQDDNIINHFVGPSKRSRHYRQFSIERIMKLLKQKHKYDNTPNIIEKSELYFELETSHERRFLCNNTEFIKKLHKVKNDRLKLFYGYECYSGNVKINWFNLSKFVPKEVLILNRNEDLYRNCEICGKEYEYAHLYFDSNKNDFFTKKIKGEYSCSEECYMKLLLNKGSYYEYSELTKCRQSEIMKYKIENGEWTPNTTNSWCKSRISSKDGLCHFRSAWEAVFYVYMKYIKNIDLNYETVRIRYINEYGIDRIYLVDFEDEKNKILYEVKPSNNITNTVNSAILKEEKAKEWCVDNGYEFKYITETELGDIVSYDILTLVLKYCNIDKHILFRRMNQFLEIG